MRTSQEFATCPMGSYIDPEKMIKARGVGMSLEELHKRGYASEFPPEKEMDPTALCNLANLGTTISTHKRFRWCE
jgi:hypothetical protein